MPQLDFLIWLLLTTNTTIIFWIVYVLTLWIYRELLLSQCFILKFKNVIIFFFTSVLLKIISLLNLFFRTSSAFNEYLFFLQQYYLNLKFNFFFNIYLFFKIFFLSSIAANLSKRTFNWLVFNYSLFKACLFLPKTFFFIPSFLEEFDLYSRDSIDKNERYFNDPLKKYIEMIACVVLFTVKNKAILCKNYNLSFLYNRLFILSEYSPLSPWFLIPGTKNISVSMNFYVLNRHLGFRLPHFFRGNKAHLNT